MQPAQISSELEDGPAGADAQGTPVDPITGLATDYLNHFNEVIMILEMLPMAPELFEEIAAWQPASYEDHFKRSGFSDWQDVVAAYEAAPAEYRAPFDETAAELSRLLAGTIADIAPLAQSDDHEQIEAIALQAHAMALPMVSVLTGLIQGRETPEDDMTLVGSDGGATQSEIDALFD